MNLSTDTGSATDSGHSSTSSNSSSGEGQFQRSLLAVANSVMRLTKGPSMTIVDDRQAKVTQSVITGLADSLKFLTELNEEVVEVFFSTFVGNKPFSECF